MPRFVQLDFDDAVATLTLNRPDRLNTITRDLIADFRDALAEAQAQDEIRVIRLKGAGRAFCAGYDIDWGAESMQEAEADAPWDPMADLAMMSRFVDAYMSLWRSPKPVIAQIHGFCVGGGSDMALCADLVIASEDAQIGTSYSRMWGCYLTGMWLYRLGLTRAKEHALTGRPLSGREAADVELINRAVPFEQLEAEVAAQAEQLAAIPLSQLTAMKLI